MCGTTTVLVVRESAPPPETASISSIESSPIPTLVFMFKSPFFPTGDTIVPPRRCQEECPIYPPGAVPGGTSDVFPSEQRRPMQLGIHLAPQNRCDGRIRRKKEN